MERIELIHGGRNLFERLYPLWCQTRDYHINHSVHFKEYFKNNAFEERMAVYGSKEKVNTVIARDFIEKKDVGYIISSVHQKKGEVESIFVSPDYRRYHIGQMLMEESLLWIRSFETHEIKIVVAYGNEAVLPFYEKMGFSPKFYLLYDQDGGNLTDSSKENRV